MSKIKELLIKMAKSYQNSFKQYTATNILIILTTLLFLFTFDNLNQTIADILLIAVLSGVGFFTGETYFNKKWQRVVSYVASIVIAIILKLNIMNLSARIYIGYILVVFLVGVIKVIKNTEVDIGEYIVKAIKNIFYIEIVYAILNAGITLILVIFMTLILNGQDSSEILWKLQIALLGLFLLPASLVAITKMKGDVSKFIKVIMLYIMLPLTIIATVIIYIYMAKIFIIREIPSNSIFKILTGLFIVAFPVWTSIYTFREQTKSVEKVCKILPISFIPFILLQTYSIYARIHENGLTPTRYIGVAFIIFEAIAIFFSLYKNRRYLIHTITTATVLITISTILPIVNMETASYICQANRLKNAWKPNQTFNQLLDENKDVAKSAYNYLMRKDDSSKYIPNYVNGEELRKNNTNDNDYYYERYEYIDYSGVDEEFIQIEGYRRMKPASTSASGQELYNMKNIKLTKSDTFDIRYYLSRIIENGKISKINARKYIEANNIIKIDEDADFYITNLSLSYKASGTVYINYFTMSGYILQK